VEFKIADLHQDFLIRLEVPHMLGYAKLKEEELRKICACMSKNLSTVCFASVVRGREKSKYAELLRQVNTYRSFLEKNQEFFSLFPERRKNRASVVLALEGCYGVRSEKMLLEFVKKGVRIFSLTWNKHNYLAGGCEKNDKGLTSLGRRCVALLMREGCIIDLAHANEKSMRDIFKTEPERYSLLASYTGIREICDIPRNIPMWVAEKIYELGGVVGISLDKDMLGDKTFAKFCEHVDLLERELGLEVIALGSDLYGMPPGDVVLPVREVCDFDLLLKKILENYSRKEAERILRRNAERVLLKRLTGK